MLALGDIDNDGVLDLVGGSLGPVALLKQVKTSAFTAASIDLRTRSGALSALSTLRTQLDRVEGERGAIGATNSRLSTAGATLLVQRENYAAAHSQIADADVAQEAANLVKSKILQESAAAVLAQANQIPSSALKLLS